MQTTEGRHPTVDEAVNIIKKSMLTETRNAQYSEWEETLGKDFVQRVEAIAGGKK
ncbi:hypothetical protein SAMN05216302_101141 [Nitrosomonas aestuarii]|uniref:Uncharacterized protein n=1 Tax=Nitrosomonas aestuarii TaxID=52441 RepID=A0A1I4B4Y8_9PROT|nr:hypothetical protein [Nitrosomonas aestuarii]SFK63972.1 hypothetical protein SAMN05216302_101141 [Nitrosomonas aestuarii]